MENNIKYVATTYQIGKTTIHVVAPPPLTEEEKERIINDLHTACWKILEGIEKRKNKNNKESTP